MNINKVLMEYDNMFGLNSLEEIEGFLVRKINEAYREQDYFSAVTLLNEIMGFCRDTSQNEKGIKYCAQVVELMNKLNLNDTVEYATTLLNVANAYRAFGLLEKSLENYRVVERIYEEKLPKGDFNYASLYNNWSLLYQEMYQMEDARDMLKRAMKIVDGFPKAKIPQATTRTNLAMTLLELGKQDEEDRELLFAEAMKYIKRSLEIFEEDGGKDFHYSGALSAMGDALYFKKDYDNSAGYYEKSMVELCKHVGETEAYFRIKEKRDKAVKRAEERRDTETVKNGQECEEHIQDLPSVKVFENNLARSKAFYEDYGASMIHTLFPDYEKRIAVGIVGEGSDCFGFDDAISTDHDYEVGFSMWLTDEDYSKIGVELHREYEKLVLAYGKEYAVGFEKNDKQVRVKPNSFIDGRRGVETIGDFYGNILGRQLYSEISAGLVRDSVWIATDDQVLATASNGILLRDDLGEFSLIRERILDYYPERVWRLKIAEQLHIFSQNAQSNYPRMMARNDYVTANICVAQGVKSAMALTYLLNRVYAPYYKWMSRGMDNLERLTGVKNLLSDISTMECQKDAWKNYSYSSSDVNMKDKIVVFFEAVAALILSELNRQGLVSGKDTFLEIYCNEIKDWYMDKQGAENMGKNELVDKIVALEWQQFDKVKNEGGRADCQDNWNTFSIMRKSQYLAWNEELLFSFYTDLKEADKKGWNLITEKYARMMESTTPDKYEELKESLPERSDERIAIQEEIIKIQVEWMEDFAEQYPKMAGNARSIHTYEDTPYNTSYETYLRGELGTYSEETLVLYGRFVVAMKQAGKNLAYEIMSNTATLYGYKSVEDAESRL